MRVSRRLCAGEADPPVRGIICGAHGGLETTEVRDVRISGEGCGLRWGPGKRRVDGVFHGRSQSFRRQRRPVDDCNPGRGGMAQHGGIRV